MGIEVDGNVTGVHFYPGKVKYDIGIPVAPDRIDSLRVYNIDSDYILPLPVDQK